MVPLLAEGDFVLATDWYRLFGPPRPGDLVVFRHAVHGVLVKQVEGVLPGGTLVVRGTRPVSLDSQEIGPVPAEDVLGKAVWVARG
jgi:hypothetical protein